MSREDLLPVGEQFSFRGARVIDPLRTATHHEIAAAFAETGLTPSNHFIMRVKDLRTEALGLHTFGDLEAIFRRGLVVPAGDTELGRLVSVQYGKFEVILNVATGRLITLKPR
jgi:hypothetical protein